MQMCEAAKVIEVHGSEEANKKLDAGWTLLTVLPAISPNNGAGYGIYVLGKPAELPQQFGML